MSTNHGSNRERYHDTAADTGKTTGRKADPYELTSEIEVLQDQIAVLEEGLPDASGMERAALAKEINAYRVRLEAAQYALGVTD